MNEDLKVKKLDVPTLKKGKVLELLLSTDPLLRQKCQPFDFKNPPIDPFDLFADLVETMIVKKGIGLAAPQVGLPYNVFIFGDPSNRELINIAFNPQIVDHSLDLVYYEEGCLSFPGLYIKIKRPREIRARYANVKGNVNTIKFDGLTSRIFQHELDHLNGVLFTTKAPRLNLERARRQKKQIDRKKAKRTSSRAARKVSRKK